MGIYEGTGQLAKAVRELLRRWEETKMSWEDAQARQFEEKYLVPVQMHARQAAGAMAQMSALLDQIRTECS